MAPIYSLRVFLATGTSYWNCVSPGVQGIRLGSAGLGVFAGWALTQLMAMGLRSELYRLPAYLSPATLSSSAIVVILAAVAAALAIRHKVAKLEPLAALGSRE